MIVSPMTYQHGRHQRVMDMLAQGKTKPIVVMPNTISNDTAVIASGRVPVWSKYSSGPAVLSKEATMAFSTAYVPAS